MAVVRSHAARRVVLVACCIALAFAGGCARAKNVPAEEPSSTVVPVNQAPVERLPSSTPKQAVAAYLSAAADAYFSLETSVVAPYVTEEQEVREDAYVELNRQQGQALEMELAAFSVLAADNPSVQATTAAVRTSETWRWRYWSLATRKPSTAWATTTYQVQYALERRGSGWLVARAKVVSQSGDTTPTPLP